MKAPSRAGSPAAASRPAPLPAALLFLHGRDADGCVRQLVALRRGVRPAFAALALGLVEGRAYQKLGFRSLGDYARERLGVTARAVREGARVWKALLGLPLLRAAVLEGEVSWSVARRAVALVTPALDEVAAATLRGRTVRAVDAWVVALRAGQDAGASTPEEHDRVKIRLHLPHAAVGRWHAALELARRMAGEPLPVWEAVEAVAAETLAALPPETMSSAWGRASPRPQAAAARRSSRTGNREHGLRHCAFPLLRWDSIGTPREPGPHFESIAKWARSALPHALDAALRRTNARLQKIDHDLGLHLRQILERKLYRELGFPSFERYAEERADLSPRTARRRVRLARPGRPGAPSAIAFREGTLTEAQAVAIGAANDPARESWWVAFALAHTLRRLEDEAAALSAQPTILAFHAPPEAASVILAALAATRLHLADRPGGAPAAADAFLWMVEHAIAAWEEQGRSFEDYADFKRDGFRCTAPGCTARRNLQSHHIVFRSHGGPDEAWNRTTLCAFHHLRGVHARTIYCSGRAPHALEFSLGLRAGGAPLLRTRSGDRLLGAAAFARSVEGDRVS